MQKRGTISELIPEIKAGLIVKDDYNSVYGRAHKKLGIIRKRVNDPAMSEKTKLFFLKSLKKALQDQVQLEEVPVAKINGYLIRRRGIDANRVVDEPVVNLLIGEIDKMLSWLEEDWGGDSSIDQNFGDKITESEEIPKEERIINEFDRFFGDLKVQLEGSDFARMQDLYIHYFLTGKIKNLTPPIANPSLRKGDLKSRSFSLYQKIYHEHKSAPPERYAMDLVKSNFAVFKGSTQDYKAFVKHWERIS